MKKKYFLVAVISFTIISTSAQFSDDMETYTEGQPISVGHWTDWGCGGGGGCAIMSSSIQSQGGNLSGYIPSDTTTDAVLDLGNKIFGEWGLSFWMYIPSEKEAHWNLQGTVPIGSGEWIVGNIFFNQDNANPGVGLIDNSAQGPINFSFPHNQWFRVVMNWDITSGIGFATWQFNVAGIDVIPPGTDFTDSSGFPPNSLGGMDFFSISENNQLWVDTFVYENNFINIEPDIEDPAAVCQDITAQLDNNGGVLINGNDIDGGSTDNVGIMTYTAVPNNFNCNDLGTNTVTLIVQDFAGNTDSCTAVVTIEDNLNPNIIGQNTLGNLNGAGSVTIPVASVDNGSSDNCGIDTLTLTPDTFTTIGTYNAVLEGIDSSGNSDNVAVIITIVDDNENPVAVCQNITVQLDNTGSVLISGNDIDGGSTDDYGIISLTAIPNNFNCNNIGGNAVTLIVEDVIGNIDTCTAIVTIEDIINPIVIGQNATGDLLGTGTVTIPVASVNNGSSDNCGIDNLTLTPNTFTETGTFTAVLEGIDSSGNSDNVTVIITIIDTLGVNDEEFTNFKMYPNPTNNECTIEVGIDNLLCLIEIYDITGKLISEKNIKQPTQSIRLDISWLSNSFYFISITDENGNRAIKKLIKE